MPTDRRSNGMESKIVMSRDKINLFTDIFKNDPPLPKRIGFNILCFWRFILLLACFLIVVFIYSFAHYRPCVEVICRDAIGVTYPNEVVVKGTVDSPVGWRCTEIDEDYCSGYAPVGENFNARKHEIDGDAEWRECECINRDWSLTKLTSLND